MDFVKLSLDVNYGNYSYKSASNEEMSILGCFLTDDVGCPKKRCGPTLKDWALADKTTPGTGFSYTIGTNATFLEEDDDGTIHLIDDTGSDPDDAHYVPARITMTHQQFVQLLDDWEEKVCKHKPKEVIVKHENNKFFIETSGTPC
jgi:hypothetical protein